jgi:hypothetical protein
MRLCRLPHPSAVGISLLPSNAKIQAWEKGEPNFKNRFLYITLIVHFIFFAKI